MVSTLLELWRAKEGTVMAVIKLRAVTMPAVNARHNFTKEAMELVHVARSLYIRAMKLRLLLVAREVTVARSERILILANCPRVLAAIIWKLSRVLGAVVHQAFELSMLLTGERRCLTCSWWRRRISTVL